MAPQLTDTPSDTRTLYSQIGQDYERAKGLVHGLMKDSIQNSFGHKVNDNGDGWGMEYELIENPDQKLLTVADWGTTGLIGDTYDNIHEVSDHIFRDPYQKLAKFEKIINPGMNVAGAGGNQGRGNTTYQHNSAVDKMMWDSLCEDGKYIANYRYIDENNRLRQFDCPYLNEEAHKFINDEANLQPLERVGLRITIFSPNEGLNAAIKDGTFSKNIGNTWHEPLGKFRKNIDGIFITVNGKQKKVELPEHWKKYYNEEYEPNHVFKKDNLPITFSYRNPDEGIERQTVTARVSQVAFILAENELDEDQRGIMVHRNNMPVNQTNPILQELDLPLEYKKRVFGFAKLESSPVRSINKSFEDMIKLAEDSVHYSLSPRFSVYGALKATIIEETETFKQRAGIRTRNAAHVERQRRRAANDATTKANEYLAGLGVGGIGDGRHRKEFIISLKDISYPRESAAVLLDDTVDNVVLRLKNKTPNVQTAELILETIDKDKHRIKLINAEEELSLDPYNNIETKPFSVKLDRDTYRKFNFSKIYIRATLKDDNGNNLANKLIPLYLGIEPDESTDKPEVVFERLNLPNDNTRVDIGDTIDSIKCLVKNQTNFEWELLLKVAVHDATSERDVEVLIDYGDPFILAPATDLTFEAGDINFSEETYGYIDEGKLIIRAQLISSIGQNDRNKGDRLSRKNQTLWLNMDPRGGGGLFDMPRFEMSLATDPRCRVTGTNGTRTITINQVHPHFISLEDDHEAEKDYIYHLSLMEGLRHSFVQGFRNPFTLDPREDLSASDIIREIFTALDTGLGRYYGS